MTDRPAEPLVEWCQVRLGGLHPATHERTTLCDLHDAEYQRAYSAWTTARSRARKKGEDIEPWEERELTITYTPVDETWTGLNERDRALIRGHQLRILGAAAQCAPMVSDTEVVLSSSAEELQALIGNLVQAAADVAILLDRFGREPKVRTEPPAN